NNAQFGKNEQAYGKHSKKHIINTVIFVFLCYSHSSYHFFSFSTTTLIFFVGTDEGKTPIGSFCPATFDSIRNYRNSSLLSTNYDHNSCTSSVKALALSIFSS